MVHGCAGLVEDGWRRSSEPGTLEASARAAKACPGPAGAAAAARGVRVTWCRSAPRRRPIGGGTGEGVPKRKARLLTGPFAWGKHWVTDGTRTHGTQGHNLVLYQLSYSHRVNFF